MLRLVLWWQFGRPQGVGLGSLIWVVPAGLFADAVQSLYLLAPFAIFVLLMPDGVLRVRAMRIVMMGCACLWIFGVLFLSAIEYYFFDEFDSRLNLVAVDYLMYPTEVVGDIRDSYPVIPVLIAAGATAIVLVWTSRRFLNTPRTATRFSQRARIFAGLTAVLLVCVVAFSADTFALSDNRVASEIAENGASSFFHALRTSEIDYNANYATRSYRANLNNLVTHLSDHGGRFTRLSEGRLDRDFPANPNGLGKLNVVVIASESFGAEFSRLYGSPHDWTPRFDCYARQSLWFSHMYASGTRTVRGLEAIVTSLPPIPSVSVLRRPGNEEMANWGSVMREQGYRTSFLYGGYGYFDNMNYFFSHNGFEVHDRQDTPGPTRFANIWGVSDEDLFDSALRYYDEIGSSGQPFFSLIMTTSNHKPFTFRAGVPGVKPRGGGREAGVRYADFAQGYFLDQARKRKWFDNTLFIIVADHGARVYGREEIPLRTYEIPMLFYAPRYLHPQQVTSLTTQIDIAPTVLGLLGLPYHAPFFGIDVLHAPNDERTALFSHNHDVALFEDGQLAILGLNKSVRNVLYDRTTDTYRNAPPNPKLNDLAVAYYQTAFELFRSHRYN